MSASTEFYDAVEYVVDQKLKSLKLHEIVSGEVVSYNATTKRVIVTYSTSSAQVTLYNISGFSMVAGDNILISHQYGAVLEKAYVIGNLSRVS